MAYDEIDIERVSKACYDFLDEFGKESDRAAVIVGAAKLDSILYQTLKTVLKPNPSTTDSLFDGDNAPLSSFSSKIIFCYRLGIIDSKLAEILHIIRKIRNNFAHNIEGCSLNDGPQRDRVRTLVGRFKSCELFNYLRKKYGKGESTDFRALLACVIITIEVQIVMKLDTIYKDKPVFTFDTILTMKPPQK